MNSILKMKELWQTLFSIQVDRTFLKVFAKNLVKVARIGEVVSRRGPAILGKLSFKCQH